MHLSRCLLGKRPSLSDLVQLFPPLKQRFGYGWQFLRPEIEKKDIITISDTLEWHYILY